LFLKHRKPLPRAMTLDAKLLHPLKLLEHTRYLVSTKHGELTSVF
jgi:hypothetical protein